MGYSLDRTSLTRLAAAAEAVTIYRELADAEPDRVDYQRDLSISNERLGDLMRGVGRGDEAAPLYQPSLDITARLGAAGDRARILAEDAETLARSIKDPWRHVESGGPHGIDPLEHARVLGERARRHITRGHPAQAESLLRQAHQLFTTAGSELEAAVVMGDIADIAFQRGDYDEALRIRREIELPVYERLGEVRSTAVCWGQIADIAFQRGDYDEALRIRREIELPVYERLGDIRSTAITWGQIADIAAERGDWDGVRSAILDDTVVGANWLERGALVGTDWDNSH